MNTMSNVDLLKELHGDLRRKYDLHAATVKNLWRSFDKHQRARCLKAGAAEGAVLEHSSDTSLGRVCDIVPEINLRDITEPNSHFLLSLLEHRATTTLLEQYHDGVDGGRGDRDFIEHMMHTRGLRHAGSFKNCFTMFLSNEEYGKSYEIVQNQTEFLSSPAMMPAVRARLVIPQSTAELVFQRQATLLQTLNIIIEDILDQGSQSRDRKKRPAKPNKAASSAISPTTMRAAPVKDSLQHLSASAYDQKADLDDYLQLLVTEPVVLAYAVNTWFFSNPELVPDEKGRMLPVFTDKYISASFFEAIHNAVKGAAIWDYITRLLELLSISNLDKTFRRIVLQELSNTCHLEYERSQVVFKRHVQRASGSQYFKRVANIYDDAGNVRVVMKNNSAVYIGADPQLQYMLRLCRPETDSSKAMELTKELNNLHGTQPLERDKMEETEVDSFYALAVITELTWNLSRSLSMPSFSRKSQVNFTSKLHDLEISLDRLKTQIDLRDFVVPIDNLLEPGVASKALLMLDRFTIEKVNGSMETLYRDLVQAGLSKLEEHYQNVKVASRTDDFPRFSATSELGKEEPEQKRTKEKTRPSNLPTYELAPSNDAHAVESSSLSSPVIKVSSEAMDVFMTLFNRSTSRGFVHWSAFEAAMTELGFSVMPKFGSAFTFCPSATMDAKKSFTIHRPHQSKIEGHRTLFLAKRLRRIYEWNEQTFEVE